MKSRISIASTKQTMLDKNDIQIRYCNYMIHILLDIMLIYVFIFVIVVMLVTI